MSIELAEKLADYIVKSKDPEMRWTWGQGIMGAALSDLDDYLGTNKYLPFLQAFCDYYVKNEPEVASADTAAPGFISYAVYSKTGKEEYKKLTDKVLDYIKNEPRVYKDAVNHLGKATVGKFYPKSIWVDSLMMFSVFPARYAKQEGDSELLEIAAKQPALYADCMMDPCDHLWYHSFWVKKGRHYPNRKLYWARGNGWVVSALPKILDDIGDHPEKEKIVEVYQKTVEAVAKKQEASGGFRTLLGKKSTYLESSAAALIADGIFHGVRSGYIGEEYLPVAEKAYAFAVSCVKTKANGAVLFTKISGPTIPLPVLPFCGYACILRCANLTYGVAAFLWASIERDKLVREGKLK
ncbi:MAG: glycoside hydrolase family 88 protein [Clostridia bacterium]|nr:glycoside hydrolase family 88 protein [Clostridia bacterium]